MVEERVVLYNQESGNIVWWNGKEYVTIPAVFPAPPMTGTFVLQSVDGVLSWKGV